MKQARDSAMTFSGLSTRWEDAMREWSQLARFTTAKGISQSVSCSSPSSKWMTVRSVATRRRTKGFPITLTAVGRVKTGQDRSWIGNNASGRRLISDYWSLSFTRAKPIDLWVCRGNPPSSDGDESARIRFHNSMVFSIFVLCWHTGTNSIVQCATAR